MPKKTFIPFVLSALLLCCAPVLAHAASRVALVIGNGAYKSSPLRNPVNDAADVAATLQALGFEVIIKTDADKRSMVAAVRTFGKKAKGAEAALFFYAGHGMQMRGTNYLIPVDATIGSEDEVEFEGLDANRILAQMESSGAAVNIVILDACRDNPFKAFRSATRGLAVVRAIKGSVVVYSTSPGDVAADGSGRNSPFTHNLLKYLASPGIGIDAMFKHVGAGVFQESHGRQTPWISSSLFGDFYMNRDGTAPAPDFAASSAGPQPSLDELIAMADRQKVAELEAQEREEAKKKEIWESIKKYSAFVASHPDHKDQAWQALAAQYPEQAAGLAPGDIGGFAAHAQTAPWVDPATGMEFVWVPEGCFQPGSTGDEKGKGSAKEVCLRGFWMGKYEVTNGQYRHFKAAYDSGDHQGNPLNGDGQPAVNMPWDDATAYARWLSGKGHGTYRLPTKVEWEYAARAGTTTDRYWGDNPDEACQYANVADRTGKPLASPNKPVHNCDDGYGVTAPEGSFLPNAFGLFDMLGNVTEWTSDRDPTPLTWAKIPHLAHMANKPFYMACGGDWRAEPKVVRLVCTHGYQAEGGFDTVGFRLVRTE